MKKTKILYVEDEPFLGRIVKESLESRDFEVAMITDGNEATAAFKESLPDICVLDIMLPSKDGYAIAKEIRQVAAEMPIIFVTAKVQTEDLLKGFEVGGNDYLRKPFSMEELIVRINNLLQLTRVQKNGSSSQEIISIGQYHFIPLRYELRFGDRTRQLSHRESTLLQTLIDNKNATALRKDILLKLWGDDSFFNSRNLDVYITKLRDYLKEDPSIKIITIKGIGYHFSVG
ncbi:DNA-binding response regulator, OmpR family, contains REC and winged-helix (wHTH) domain [Chryseolinea serpens]|uniref:DNA-binding response regulator, OmpR family, contains REC and winged-helix (WHTH) domain n=1 Tax=Chryseolinea serpens TaxID=947013 RepID=A0A1M5XA11_9BACT|nr:response regulator transcription factor [Chryseolinea serpens]SHH96492.1 DNA-binding response regulator, OmpR family, contains REC and winged-helix (wHTH) domain [Chryseolinea serpens]